MIPGNDEERVKIIDTSVFQGAIDWGQVKDSGVSGVYNRLTHTDGKTLDPLFAENWRRQKDAGLNRGFYALHYGWLDPVQTAETSMNLFYEATQGDYFAGEMRPALDVEPSSAILPAIDFAKHLRSQLLTLEQLFRAKFMIYTSARCFKFINPNNDQSWVSDHDLWIANYIFDYQLVGRRTKTWRDFIPTFQPAIPNGWKDFTVWQAFGDDGMQTGVDTPCDLDLFNGTHDDYSQWMADYHREKKGNVGVSELTAHQKYERLKDAQFAKHDEKINPGE